MVKKKTKDGKDEGSAEPSGTSGYPNLLLVYIFFLESSLTLYTSPKPTSTELFKIEIETCLLQIRDLTEKLDRQYVPLLRPSTSCLYLFFILALSIFLLLMSFHILCLYSYSLSAFSLLFLLFSSPSPSSPLLAVSNSFTRKRDNDNLQHQSNEMKRALMADRENDVRHLLILSTLPYLTSPHLTSPHLTSPHLTSPHLTSPLLSSSHYLLQKITRSIEGHHGVSQNTASWEAKGIGRV